MENHADQLNREMRELLEEIRIILPGVQILGALLLTVPFTNRFTSFDSTERVIYFIGFLATAVATVLLVAPSAQHRILWRRPIKDRFLDQRKPVGTCGHRGPRRSADRDTLPFGRVRLRKHAGRHRLCTVLR